MTHVFHRDQRQTYPVAVRGEGCYIIDSQGRRYLDAAGGAAVSCLGHSDAEVIAAIEAQLRRLPYAVTSFFTTEPAEQLADLLASDAPPGLDKVWFALDGSEAVESALKLARQWALETGQPQRREIISRRQSFHGNTLGALSAGGNASRRAPYEPLLVPMQPRLAVLRLSRAEGRRVQRRLRRAPRAGAGTRNRAARNATRSGLHRRDRGRRDARLDLRCARAISAACARSATATGC